MALFYTSPLHQFSKLNNFLRQVEFCIPRLKTRQPVSHTSQRTIFSKNSEKNNTSAIIENILGIELLTDQVVTCHYLQTPFKSQTTVIPSKQQIFELLLGSEKMFSESSEKNNTNVKILSYLYSMAIPVMEFQVR